MKDGVSEHVETVAMQAEKRMLDIEEEAAQKERRQ
jgi:hypothetical protein